MVEEMKFQWKWNPISLYRQHNHLLVKFAISFLLLGLAFRLFLSDSIQFHFAADVDSTVSPASSAVADTSPAPPPHVSVEAPAMQNRTPPTATRCDIFTGEWIRDQMGPSYTNESCSVIEGHQNCITNGRPDSAYLYWRWSPADCELPRFEPGRFLDLMRNKRWAFVGDSISRNHVQSLLCILSQVEEANEVYHDKEYKSKRWHFPSHNFTLSVIWTPFLIKADIFEDTNGVSSSEVQLHLDELDQVWTEQFGSFDYVIIGVGKWFLKTAIYHENDTIVGCHYCPGRNLTELGFDYAYRKTLQLVFNFVTGVEGKKMVIFRTSTPDHFENGEWFSGGYCNRTLPFKEGEVEMVDVDKVMRGVELEEFEKFSARPENGVALRLLDTTRLSLLRPDGHPGPYRKFHPFAQGKEAHVQNDCLHWCLPGPIDSWSDLVMQLVING